MINCHKYFITYSNKISINKTRQKQVQGSQREVVKVLSRYVEYELGLGKVKFLEQGSYRFNTVIVDYVPDYDLDLGMYLNSKPKYTPRTLKSKINDKAIGISWYGAEDKLKCIQIYFRDEYSIDVPIYYFDKKHKKSYIATKTGWEISDSIGFDKWVKSRLNRNKQAIRLIKYLKHWSNSLSFKTPSGVALTVLVMKHHKSDPLDDVSFVKTLRSIYKNLQKQRKCIMPVEPYDNLLRKLSKKQISSFIEKLKCLIHEGENALRCDSIKNAILIWRSNLGDYFPIKI